jgi:5-formyltetrahydrofolate cyclo-ligase
VDRSKGEWRRVLIGVRRQLTAEQVAEAGAGLVEVASRADVIRHARCVAAYVSMPPEPDTAPLLGWLKHHGVRVLLPVLRDDNDLGWGEAGSGLVTARYGLTQPAADLGIGEIRAAEAVLAPALAVDRNGTRLGRGGGSYDRALARADAPIIATIYDAELVDELPYDDHDHPVDFALTPRRLVAIERSS